MEEQLNNAFMELMNWPAFLVASLVPMILGMIWYSPKTPMGAIWMKETGMTDEKMKGSNMPLIMGLSIFFCFLMNFFIISHEVIHQYGAFSLLKDTPEEAVRILTEYKGVYRTFGHGALHGAFLGIAFVLPLFGMNGMFNRKSWKLIWVDVSYWTISIMIMGGILCAWQ